MRNALQIIRATPTARLQRASGSVIAQFAVNRDYDRLNRPHAFIVAAVACPPPNGTGRIHKVEARLYNPHGSTSPTWVSCSCEDAKYMWEVALTKQHSSSVRYSNGAAPRIKNPGYVAGACKHILRLLTYAVRSSKVRKILFDIPVKEIKQVKPLMKQRGIPERLPRGGRSRPKITEK